MSKITVVVGAQFGSEGKGAVAGFLGKRMGARDMAIRVAGPNAGHTVYGDDHREWKLRAVPVAAVTSPDCQLHIAAGSEIDHNVLFDEIEQLDRAGYDVSGRLSIHPSATYLNPRYISVEKADGIVDRIGSTGKGIGAARSARIARTAHLAKDVSGFLPYLGEPGPLDLDDIGDVVIEGTQGYGLGLHTEFYPQVTSSDCRAIDFLAMAGISPWAYPIREFGVVLVARVFPIRVAGNSGPLKGETSWEALGLGIERTTVTNKVRRVGAWDGTLVEEAIRANGGGDYHPAVTLAITMLDQIFPTAKGKLDLDDEQMAWVEETEGDLQTHISYVGTGPETMVEL